MSTTFWSAIIPSNYSGERELKVQLSNRPLRLTLVSVERTISSLKSNSASKDSKDEHALYFASKFHRGSIQLCRFLSRTTQNLNIIFDAGDNLHFKVFGDTQAPMYLVGNLLDPVPEALLRKKTLQYDRDPAIIAESVVIEI